MVSAEHGVQFVFVQQDHAGADLCGFKTAHFRQIPLIDFVILIDSASVKHNVSTSGVEKQTLELQAVAVRGGANGMTCV
jgi:hypothetical protein